jgi:hypothetical protein
MQKKKPAEKAVRWNQEYAVSISRIKSSRRRQYVTPKRQYPPIILHGATTTQHLQANRNINYEADPYVDTN